MKLQKKKQILADPVAIFTSQQPGPDAEDKARLNHLCEQMSALKQQFHDYQTRSKLLSRKIGEAKNNNQSASNHIQTMRENSIKLKQVTITLKDIEKQILAFFVADSGDAPLNKKTSSHDSRYTANSVNINEITISLLKNEQSAWNNYVSNHPAATIYHRSEWRDLLNKTYGMECPCFFAHNQQNQITGVLPLARLKSLLFGDLLVSMPYFQRGGAIADNCLIEEKLMQAANDYARQHGVDHIEYRDDIQRDGLPGLSNKVNMVLQLPDSAETLWKGFTPKLRAQIKKPQRVNPQVLIGGKEYLDDFHKVYTRNMRDLGSPAHSKLLVENILNSFPENSWIIVLRFDNKPVSAGLLLGHGQTMEIPLASTIREANPLSMNMLLYWEVLKLAIQYGYKTFDFGRSSKGAGTYRFKQQWGAQPKQLYWHYWLSEKAEMPRLTPDNPRYAVVISIWKRLPVLITKWLGPRIVRNLP